MSRLEELEAVFEARYQWLHAAPGDKTKGMENFHRQAQKFIRQLGREKDWSPGDLMHAFATRWREFRTAREAQDDQHLRRLK